jgi:hypothetical protein
MDRESLIAQAQREQVELALFREALNLRLPAPVEAQRTSQPHRPLWLMPVRRVVYPDGRVDTVFREVVEVIEE